MLRPRTGYILGHSHMNIMFGIMMDMMGQTLLKQGDGHSGLPGACPRLFIKARNC